MIGEVLDIWAFIHPPGPKLPSIDDNFPDDASKPEERDDDAEAFSYSVDPKNAQVLPATTGQGDAQDLETIAVLEYKGSLRLKLVAPWLL